MTDDRSLERAARAWLEAGPTQAPDRPIDAALARIQTTTQERDLRVPWRPRTMLDRLAVAAVAAVVAIGTLTFGVSLITRPSDPAAGACPRTVSEATAIDTTRPGVPPAERAWGSGAGAPPVRPGRLAVFATEPPDNVPPTVVLVDATTGARCILIELASNYLVQGPGISSLDWSPTGDALAVGLEGADRADSSGQENGVVLIWTAERLLRAWSGPGLPMLEWAPDGRSLAVWVGPLGRPDGETRVIHADGSADTTFAVAPYGNGLLWSPDGTRLLVSEAVEDDVAPETSLSVIDVADGRATPVDGLPGHVRPIEWLDDDRVLVATIERGQGVTGTFVLPVADPGALKELPLLEDGSSSHVVPSPDRTRLLYLADQDENGFGELSVIPVSTDRPGRTPVRLAPGTPASPVGLAWSPDGAQVVFWGLDNALWIVNADGTGLRQVPANGVAPVDDPWQPVPVR